MPKRSEAPNAAGKTASERFKRPPPPAKRIVRTEPGAEGTFRDPGIFDLFCASKGTTGKSRS